MSTENTAENASSQSPSDAPIHSAPATETSPVTESSPAAPPAAEAHAPISSAAPHAEPTESEEAVKRRVQLNPTFIPGQARALAVATGAIAPVAPEVPADEVGQAVQEAIVQAASQPAHAPKGPVELPPKENLDAAMEAEIAAAMSNAPLPELREAAPIGPEAKVDEEAPPSGLTEGAKVSGTIQSITGDDVFVDIGSRMPGVVSLRQFSPKRPPVVGEKVGVFIAKIDEASGLIACNLPRGTSKVSGDWDALSDGQVVECMVEKTNKGGLDVKVGSLRGFMPASQVDMGYVANLESFVGQKLRCKVTEVKPARRRLVVSRRMLLMEERESSESEMMETIDVGQSFNGRVKSVKDYGAFIDLGGVDGFLHIGQMSWVRISHPSEVLQEGQQVQVQVLTVDKATKKISLGMRQLSQNPWVSVETKYPKGFRVSGKVTRTEPFGAFVELEPGVEGLIHISELDHKRVRRVTDILNVGQEVEAQVVELDPTKKRISLSLKALSVAPPEEMPPEEPETRSRRDSFDRRNKGQLKGGTSGSGKPGMFGNPRDFQ